VAPLDLLAAEPALAALFLDIDGVLAPIVERPEDAYVPESTRSELERLSARYGLVACVTGRTAEDARRIVGVDALRYVGEHGLELAPEADGWGGRIRSFATGVAWDDVEVKPLSAAFHYRTKPDPDAARAELEAVVASALESGFRTRWGRMVLEVLPPVDGSKGRPGAARRDGPAAGAVRGRRHDRPRRVRGARRARGRRPGGGVLARGPHRPRPPGRPRRRLDRGVRRAATAAVGRRRSATA
jgi:trehalose 6-phosphate phosphatase